MNKLTKLLTAFLFCLFVPFFSGCSNEAGVMRFKPETPDNVFTAAGKLNIPTIIETELGGVYASTRGSLAYLQDYSCFKLEAGGITANADKDGSFILENIPIDKDVVITALGRKLKLMFRLTENDILFKDTKALKIDWNSTAEALLYELGKKKNKYLSPGDIRAREYTEEKDALIKSIWMTAQVSPSSVKTHILDLPSVKNPAEALASKISERESSLNDSNNALRNTFVIQDIELLKNYVSPSFSNDWDDKANYTEFINTIQNFFRRNEFKTLSWDITETEFLPENTARLRTRVSAIIRDKISETEDLSQTWVFDAYWRKEGTFWKVWKNLPYKVTDPKVPGAGNIWKEISAATADLKEAIETENISILEKHISKSFTNDFDEQSCFNDIIMNAQIRFVESDVKLADYKIDDIESNSDDGLYFTVKCRGRVVVQNFIPLIDIDSGFISATIQWRKENGVWKIYKNLPYKFRHKKVLGM